MRMKIPSFLATAAVLAGVSNLFSPVPAAGQRTRRSLAESSASPGALLSILPDGQIGGLCPLVHTDVKADSADRLRASQSSRSFRIPFRKRSKLYTHSRWLPMPPSTI